MRSSKIRTLVGVLMLFAGFAAWYFSYSRTPQPAQKDFASYSPSPSLDSPEKNNAAAKTNKRQLPSSPIPNFTEPPNSVVIGVQNGHSPKEIEELTQIPILRGREVQIRENLIHQIISEKQGLLHFALFDDTRITAKVKVKKNAPIQGLFITGTVEGYPVSDISLTLTNSIFVGRISLGNRGYQIVSSSRKTHYIVEVDPSRLPQVDKGAVTTPPIRNPQNAKNLSPSQSFAKINLAQAPTSLDAPLAAPPERTIRLIFFYTPNARMAAGSADAIRAEITNEINIANSVFEKSGINAALELALIQETNYPESSLLAHDLRRLTQLGDGFMDEVQSLKRTYNADMVHLMVSVFQRDACGIHWLGNNISPYNISASKSYGVSARNCSYKMTVTHEIGHGLGADHDPANMTQGSVSWARGLVDLNAKFRTMMAYITTCNNDESVCPVVPYFSNTVTTFNGRPLGNSNANNAARIQQLVPEAALYSSAATIEPSAVTDARNGEVTRLTIWLPPGYANPTRVQWFQAPVGGTFSEIPGAFNSYYDHSFSSPVYFYARAMGPNYDIQTALALVTNDQPRTSFLIERHPSPTTINQGQSANLNVLVQTPKEAVNYSWFYNGQQVGSNSSNLNFIPSISGDVHVVVSNGTGSITSNKARIEVISKPVFTKDLPSELMIPNGRPFNDFIQVTVSGGGNITYKWFKDSVEISGKTQYFLTFVGNIDDSVKGNYWVVAKNNVGETRSVTMRVDTYNKPNITVQPSPTEILFAPGKYLSLAVQAQGYNVGYRWHRNGQPIGDAENTSAKNPSLIINSLSSSDEGVYYAKVFNGAGEVNSVEVYVGTPSQPVIHTQPADLSTFRGAPATFRVIAKSYPAPQYRWTRTINGVSTQLSTNSFELIIPKTDWEHQAQYTVEVSNAHGTVRSNPAVLRLAPILRAGTIELTKDKSKVPLSRTGGFLPVENLGDVLKEHP